MRKRRRMFSVARQLLSKSQEAALTAIQVFNNPLVRFKTETFIVLMIIAWTYLLHAYYRRHGIEYRHYRQKTKRRVFERTKDGNYKYWELRRCLEEAACPLDAATKKNLLFLLGLRNEIEHRMSPVLDNYLSARYQACCLNYNYHSKKLFGERFGIDRLLCYSLQLTQLSEEQIAPPAGEEIPENVRAYIVKFDAELSEEDLNSERFAYRLLFVRNVVGKAGQADRAIEFLPAESEAAKAITKEYWVVKDREKPKYRPSTIVTMMRGEGFIRFSMHHHTRLWKRLDAKNQGELYGYRVESAWFWYDRWVEVVRQHCRDNRESYT